MRIRSLGYVAVEATDLDEWRHFATEVVGMMIGSVDTEDALWLRTDERSQRWCVTKSSENRFAAAGWQLRDDLEFEESLAALTELGVAYDRSTTLAAERGVAEVARFADPAGNPNEIFWGAQVAPTPFVSPKGVAGFLTGDQGLGHVVMAALPFSETDLFYRRELGFALTDYADMGGARGHFLHINRRHHSLALIEAPKDAWFCKGGVVHVMVQMNELSDVGRALTRATDAGCEFFETLGEHANDRMTSFYVFTPAGFPLEIGAGASEVDPETWVATNVQFPDIWGHQVLGIPTS